MIPPQHQCQLETPYFFGFASLWHRMVTFSRDFTLPSGCKSVRGGATGARCTWWLDSPSGMGLSCGGGCFSSDTVTSRYPASSSSSAGVKNEKWGGKETRTCYREQEGAIRDSWDEEGEERRSYNIFTAASYRSQKEKEHQRIDVGVKEPRKRIKIVANILSSFGADKKKRHGWEGTKERFQCSN